MRLIQEKTHMSIILVSKLAAWFQECQSWLVSQSVSQSTTLAQTGKDIHGPQRINPHNIGLQFVQNISQ